MTDVPQLMQEIQDKLAKGEVECLICIDIVRGSAPIWSCSNCYSIFHLKCIKKWARAPTSVDLSVEKNQSGNWRCPGCQSVQQLTAKEIRYVCFCGKQPDPPMDLYRTPHSCGEPCGKPLEREVAGGGGDGNDDDRCPHVCVIQCHPGPCPPCDTFTARACHCGKMTITTKCSDRKSMRITCEEPCNKLLECGRHSCERFCHHGPCDPCPVLIQALCFCNKKKEFLLCGEIVWKDDVGRTDGVYSCNSSCGQKLACGKHFCGENCHPGLCGDCKLTTCSQICVKMAPRRGLGKRSYGLVMRAPHPPVTQLDERWFRSEAAQARFPWYDRKNIESGRRANLEQLYRFDVQAAFDRLGWLPVITYTVTTRPNLVKHFFANLELHGDVNDPNHGREIRISSFVKGVPISFDTHQLADLLGVPNDGDLVYCPPKVKGYLSESLRREIADQLLNPGAPMKAASMRPSPRIYSRIIQHNIVPQSGHYNELSQLTQYVTYCVCTGERISLPYLIIRTMHQATLVDQGSNLPYGRLITTLLQHLRVDMQGEVAAEDTMTSDIDWDAILRMQMDSLPVSDDEMEARPRLLRRVVAAAAAAANVAHAVEAESDDEDSDDRAEDVPVPAPQPIPAAPQPTPTAGLSHPPSDPVMSMLMEIRDTQRGILDTQREMGQELGRLSRSLRVTQDQVHWLREVYERDYDIADPVPSRPATPP